MSGDIKSTAKKPIRGPKEDNNRTYFTKNNLKFVSRKIPTLKEMIVEGNYQPRSKHECKLHTSWTSIQSQDINSEIASGGEKSILHGQIPPSTISFATLYKPSPTSKSDLPKTYEKNPYQRYIIAQKRLAEKCLNIEEMQLERLEKENEDEINKISEQFCRKVQSWDEVDTTVADALQSLSPLELDGGNPLETVAQGTLQQNKLEKLVITKDLSHLTNPEWVSDLFRIRFGTPWSDGYSKVLKEQEGTNNICKGLGIPVLEMRQQRIKPERIQADKELRKEAAKPKVAFGRTVPRAKGLEEYEKPQRTPSQRLQDMESKKQQILQMDLVTMRAIWGNQLNSHSTRYYCKHLRELIRQKTLGTTDQSLANVTLPQMKPKVLLDAGLLSLEHPEVSSTSSSFSSSSSLNSMPPVPIRKKK